jgi:hypothetical protein
MESGSEVTTTVASGNKDDATIAECLQAVETLSSMFGFDIDVANQAVDAVGPDVTTCYNYILDQALAKDPGGAVYPIDNCPHLKEHFNLAVDQIPKRFLEIRCCGSDGIHYGGTEAGLKGEMENDGQCPLGENWMCLECSKVFCSRYINGHCVQHWKDTKLSAEGDDVGHCVAVSFADLSVWCHTCQSYIRHTSLQPILKHLEKYKFLPNS